ncbi:MAG: isochorismatase [Trueperaceae bacterium]|jgi:nicotinamidase-related amidase|nr:isochorismatase [Trueperaceae bacterium]
MRRRVLVKDKDGRRIWQAETQDAKLVPSKTALLLCDVWDSHWSQGARERLDDLIPLMDEVVQVAREAGVQIIHAPSDTMSFYAGMPARQRVLDTPTIEVPPDIERADPPLPIDDSDHGSDTDDPERKRSADGRLVSPWNRQHAGIKIDQERDGISDDGREIFSFLRPRSIERVIVMGVHTNMCVLNRSFAIKQLVRWGFEVALIRDLTDSLYNPSMPPYVSHEEGTRLVVEYIEAFWCPSISSAEVLKLGG